MSSESLQELLAEIKSYPDGADILITAFYTAAHHYRRSTICTPFPTEILPPDPVTKEKDYTALQRALASLPPVHTLLGGADVLLSLPQQSRALLQWLLLNPARRRRFTLCPLGEMMRQLRQRVGGTTAAGSGSGVSSFQMPAFSGHNSPAFVLRAHDGHDQEPFANGVIAYHGTHLENLHSIIHTGLQSGSGTRLQRTGSIFGEGIYLSTYYDTAFSFCQPCASWPRSRFGTKLRVLLVCEVDMDKCSSERGPQAEAGARAAAAGQSGPPPAPSAVPSSSPPSSGSSLPDTYILAQRSDAVRILFVLVFCDAARTARPARVNWCTLLVLLYAGFLVCKALLAALKQHRY